MFHFDALPFCHSVFLIWTSGLGTSKIGNLYRWKQFELFKRVVISKCFTVDSQFWNILPSPNDGSRSVYQWNRRLSNIHFLMSTPGEGDCIYLDIDVLFYPCPKDGPNFRPKANEMGGKKQFPYMVRRFTRNIPLHSISCSILCATP